MKHAILLLISFLIITNAGGQQPGREPLDKATLLRFVIVKKIGVFEVSDLSKEQVQKYLTVCLADEEYTHNTEKVDSMLAASNYSAGIRNALGLQAREIDKAIDKESISNQLLKDLKIQKLETEFDLIVWMSMMPDVEEEPKGVFKLKKVTGKPVDTIIERLSSSFKKGSTVVLPEDLANNVNEKADPLLARQFERLRELSDKIEAAISVIMQNETPKQ